MQRLTEITLDYPRTAAAILLIATVGLGAGALSLRTEHGYAVLIGSNHPAIRTLDDVIERFGGGLPATILWECGPSLACAEPLDRRSLEVARGITNALERVASVRNVVSPSNESLVLSDEQGLVVRKFFEHGKLVADHTELAGIALKDPLWRERLVSPTGRAAAIYVQPVDSENSTNEAVLDAIFDAIAPYEGQGFEFYLNGDAPLAVVAGRELDASTTTIIPALVVVIGLVIWGLAGSLKRAVASLATMGVALLWTAGMMGWLGWPQDGIHQVLAPLILVVGVCDTVHLLARVPRNWGERS